MKCLDEEKTDTHCLPRCTYCKWNNHEGVPQLHVWKEGFLYHKLEGESVWQKDENSHWRECKNCEHRDEVTDHKYTE